MEFIKYVVSNFNIDDKACESGKVEKNSGPEIKKTVKEPEEEPKSVTIVLDSKKRFGFVIETY